MMRVEEWNSKILASFAGIVLAGALAFIGWVTIAVNERPDRTEVLGLIETAAPYMRDRNMILSTLEDSKETNSRLTEAIDNNTKVIIRLQAVLEREER